MALSDEEKAQLEALQRKAEEPDDSDYDVEIWDETGAGAKVPFSKAQKFLNRFGIGIEEPPADDTGKNGKAKTDKEPTGKSTDKPTVLRHFSSNRKTS